MASSRTELPAVHRVFLLTILAVLLGAACSEPDEPARPTEPTEPAAPRAAASSLPATPRAGETRTTAPGLDLPAPARSVLRHSAAHGARAQALYTTEAEPDEIALRYTEALRARALRVEPRAEDRVREPARFREVLDGFAADDATTAAATVTIERGPSGLTRVSLDQRRAYGPDFDSGTEPRAWRVIARAPLPAVPGEAVTECTRATGRACGSWAAAGDLDALSCAMDHRAPCVRTDDPIYLARSVVDARQRLIAALRAHDSVRTSGARAETEAQLVLERVGAEAVLYRATDRLDAAGAAELAALGELVRALPVGLDPAARPAEWFAPPAGTATE